MRRISRRTAIRQSGAAALLASSSVRALAKGASGWPSKPIRIIVNYAPGGGSDDLTRPYSERLSKAIGQQVIVENRGGASGVIGAEAMIKSPPDGYTFLATPSLTVVILPHLRKLTFDPLKDLVPVTNWRRGAPLHDAPVGPGQLNPGGRRLCQGEPGQAQFDLLSRWNPKAGANDGHQLRLERLFRSKSIMAWSGIVRDAVSGKLELQDAGKTASARSVDIETRSNEAGPQGGGAAPKFQGLVRAARKRNRSRAGG